MFTVESGRPVKYNIKTHNSTHNLQNDSKEKRSQIGDMGITLSPGYKTKRRKLEKDVKNKF